MSCNTKGSETGIDRLSIRSRPPGIPVMYQSWGKLLFLHWPIPAQVLRPLIPSPLQIDTYNDTAWIGITPFTMWNIRPRFIPPLPLLSTSHELNVRTYVHLNGVPGIWFLSLDASNALAVLVARLFTGLPYYQAKMQLEENGETIRYSSIRSHSGASKATFRATWTCREKLPELQPESRDFFLIERYCLYTVRGGNLFRARIFHHPWPLRRAVLSSLESTMIGSHDLPEPKSEPLLHCQAAPLDVGIWPLEKV